MREPLEKPNIILINCDDLGYGDLGCYGSLLNQTPTLDRLAAEGVRFTDFYMASPVCSPSRAAMLTACYPKRIGFSSFDEDHWVLFPGDSHGIHPDEITIAGMLKSQGYATKLVGKWHCGDQIEFLPTRYGFDSYYGLPYSNDMGRQAGRSHMPPLPLIKDTEVIQQQPDQASLTERYVEECVRFIRENSERPFFLYFAHMYVHLPLYAPKHFLETSQNGAYGAAVACIDWSTNVLLAELNRLGLDENTLVIFTSDNGSRGDHGGSNQPLRGQKGTCWEGGQRVPCIFRWIGQIPTGKTCQELITSMDFLPTIARISGIELPQQRILDGKDVYSVITGKTNRPRETFFYYLKDELRAVRWGKWKLHVSRDGEPICELYNLEDDISETSNLAVSQPEIVAKIQDLADQCRQDIGDSVTGAKGNNCRLPGKVENPRTLTQYDPDHPYIIALYDLLDAG